MGVPDFERGDVLRILNLEHFIAKTAPKPQLAVLIEAAPLKLLVDLRLCELVVPGEMHLEVVVVVQLVARLRSQSRSFVTLPRLFHVSFPFRMSREVFQAKRATIRLGVCFPVFSNENLSACNREMCSEPGNLLQKIVPLERLITSFPCALYIR